MSFAIAYTTESISSLENIMRAGSKVIREIWNNHPDKISQRNLRLAIFSGKVSVSPEKMDLIKAIKTHEMEIIGSFSRLIDSNASKFSRSSKNTILDFEDFRSEFLITAMDAMYSFVKDDIKFSTYLSFCMNNRGINMIKEQSDQFAVREADFSVEHNLEKPAPEGTNLETVYTMQEVLKSLELSDWEQAVLDDFLKNSNETGWQTRLAESYINPQTGKKYSKPAVKIALDRVFDKVKEKLGNAA